MGAGGNQNDKYNRKYVVNTSGDIIDQASTLKAGELGTLVSSESHIRVETEGLTGGTVVLVKARLKTSSVFQTIATLTGSQSKLADLTTWDVIHFEVSAYDGTPGHIIATAFVKNAAPGLSTGGIIDSDGDELDVNPDGSINVVANSATSPLIHNITIGAGDIGIEQSQVLSTGTKKILLRHRGSGKLEFAFTASFTEFITISKGTNYFEEGLNLTGKTLYFKSDKVGVIEILEWS